MAVTELTAADRLMALLQAALAQADACDNTLVAALLTECIATLDREPRVPPVADR